MEIWKDIKGYKGLYQVSSLGNVYSFITNKTLSKYIGNAGYYQVKLYKDGGITWNIHVLIVNTFLGNSAGNHTNHINSIKTDNNISNLEIVHARENASHCRIKKGTSKFVGVHYRKDRGTWRSIIMIDKKSIKIGCFDAEIDAAKAYIDALEKHNVLNKYATDIYNKHINALRP